MDNDSDNNEERHRSTVKCRKEQKRLQRGYTMFTSDNSDQDDLHRDHTDQHANDLACDLDRGVRSPNAKLKKHSKPSFKFSTRRGDKTKDSRDKDLKEKEKSERHERKEARRRQIIQNKKDRRNKDSSKNSSLKKAQPIFGIPLALAVSRSPSNDGVLLPALFRDCIDYIEDTGLDSEGIYRVSGVKSKVHALKDLYNNGKGSIENIRRHEPNVIASLLKLFIRELSEPILTEELQNKFETASSIKNPSLRIQEIQVLIDELPASNRLILSWTILHMRHVIDKRSVNKMSLQNVSIVLSPTLRISHRLLYILFTQFTVLFCGITLKPHPCTSDDGSCRRATVADVEAELAAEEAALNQLHQALIIGDLKGDAEDEIWEIQRKVTELKRSLKSLKRSEAIMSASTAGGTLRRRSSTQPNIIMVDKQIEGKMSLRKKNLSGDGPEVIKRRTTPPLGDSSGGGGDRVDGTCASKQNTGHSDEDEEDDISGCQARSKKTARTEPPKVTPSDAIVEKMNTQDNKEEEEEMAEKPKDHQQEQVVVLEQGKPAVKEDDNDEHESDTRDENHLGNHILRDEFSTTDEDDDDDDDEGIRVCSQSPKRMSPIPMTDRPPSVVLKPRAYTIHTTGISDDPAVKKLSPVEHKYRPAIPPVVVVAPLVAAKVSVESPPIGVQRYDHLDDDDKLELLTLVFIEEELLAMGNELKQKQAAEIDEMDRLKTEIGDIRDVHSRLYNESDSEDGYSADDDDDDDEEMTPAEQRSQLRDLQEEEVILSELRETLHRKIAEERSQCLDVKVRIRLIQHQQQTS